MSTVINSVKVPIIGAVASYEKKCVITVCERILR